MLKSELIRKYNIAVPRYTSYPTVPYWDGQITEEQWKGKVKDVFDRTNTSQGISLYIHLPFCEKMCTFCGCNTRITVNHAVESPYMNAILKEWGMYLNVFGGKPMLREIHLGGGTPTFFSPENLKTMLSAILETADIAPDAEFGFEAHPNNTTTEHLQALYDLGFRRLSLGVQDLDPVVQEVINRIQPFERVEKVVNEARRIGYDSINFDLIYGLPLQKLSSVTNTIAKVNELRPDRIAFYSYAHVPWVKPGQRKFTELDLPRDEEKRELYERGREMFEQAGYVEIGMDHFSLPEDTLYKAMQEGKLHRNFMGYAHNYNELQLGLGVSSISDSWHAYAQNVKKVEEYYAVLEENRLPIFKGHLLNEEDLILRRHILNMMCRGETNWKDAAAYDPFLDGIHARLSEMEADGLVELGERSVKLTTAGVGFSRNACMAFDARLWRSAPTSQIFSAAI